MKRILILTVLAVFLATSSSSYAYDEQQFVSSAQKLVLKWKQAFDPYMIRLNYYSRQNPSQGYIALKFKNLGLDYDVKRTDSLTSPYEVIIDFSADICADTWKSYTKFTNQEEAVSYAKTSANDCHPVKYIAKYSVKNGQWVLSGGNQKFVEYFLDRENSSIEANKPFYEAISSQTVE